MVLGSRSEAINMQTGLNSPVIWATSYHTRKAGRSAASPVGGPCVRRIRLALAPAAVHQCRLRSNNRQAGQGQQSCTECKQRKRTEGATQTASQQAGRQWNRRPATLTQLPASPACTHLQARLHQRRKRRCLSPLCNAQPPIQVHHLCQSTAGWGRDVCRVESEGWQPNASRPGSPTGCPAACHRAAQPNHRLCPRLIPTLCFR